MKKVGIGLVLTVLILFGGAFFFTLPSKNDEIPIKESDSYEYFWGDGCIHCAKVEEFFESSDQDEKVKLIKYEVWYERQNVNIMKDRFNKCSPKLNVQMSVPFLVTSDNKCLMGDEEIINFFRSI